MSSRCTIARPVNVADLGTKHVNAETLRRLVGMMGLGLVLRDPKEQCVEASKGLPSEDVDVEERGGERQHWTFELVASLRPLMIVADRWGTLNSCCDAGGALRRCTSTTSGAATVVSLYFVREHGHACLEPTTIVTSCAVL